MPKDPGLENSPAIREIRKMVAQNLGFDESKIDDDAEETAKLIGKPISAEAAMALYTKELSTLSDQKIVEDLEQFSWDQAINEDQLRDRLIEQNLEDAVRLLQQCTALRKDYLDLAKAHVDSRLKSEEFFRLDDIHKLEVYAGLYSLPFIEAVNERDSLEEASEYASQQVEAYSKLFDAKTDHSKKVSRKNLFDGPRFKGLDEYLAKAGDVVVWVPQLDGNAQNHVRDDATAIASYDKSLEAVSYQGGLIEAKINFAALSERHKTAEVKATYLNQDIAFRSRRAAVSREIAYAQLAENNRHNSILNYRERLRATSALFNLTVQLLMARVLVLRRAGKALYGIDIPIWHGVDGKPRTPPKGSLVDSIALWLSAFQDETAKFRRKERVFISTVWLPRVSGKKDVTVALSKKDFFGQPKVLLRGIAFEFLTDRRSRPLELIVQPPASVTGNIGKAPEQPVVLMFGRIMPMSPALDIKAAHADLVWNGDPFGEWKIAAQGNVDDVSDIAMHLWAAVS